MEEVNLIVAASLWGHRSIDWLVLPSMGRFGGIVIIWDHGMLKSWSWLALRLRYMLFVIS